MSSQMTQSHLTLSDLEITIKHFNRKAYMTSPMTASHLTLSDLERSNSRSFRFRSIISCKGTELGRKLLLNINRKAHMGSPKTQSHLTLSDLPREVKVKVTQISKPYIS